MNFIKKFEEYLLKESYDSSIDSVDFPDGIYDGIRGGYVVKIKDTDIYFKTNNGVRCMNCPCKIQIINKIAYII